MDSNTGGQSQSDLSRQAAAAIARRKVLASYTRAAEKSGALEAAKSANNADSSNTRQESHLKDAPVNPELNSESWKQYHSAWQDYYQKYYSEYYANAARQYIAKEQLKAAREEQAEEENLAYALARAGGRNEKKSGLSITSVNQEYQDTDDDSILRHIIRKKASDSARKTRKFRKFIPIMLGVFVTLLILFLQYNRLIFAPIYAYVSPGNAPAGEIEAIDPTITQTVSSDPRLIIPKLNIDVPIRFGVALDDVMAAMNNGVAHYRIAGASAYPGEIGNFIITGHSAGDIYSANPYKFIFSGLERLEDNDLIYVNYESVRYTYRVVKKEVIEPTNVEALMINTDRPILTLVTCTPVGTSRYRLLVTGEQISPSFADADTATEITDSTVVNEALPSNEPSFFENVWDFLTGN